MLQHYDEDGKIRESGIKSEPLFIKSLSELESIFGKGSECIKNISEYIAPIEENPNQWKPQTPEEVAHGFKEIVDRFIGKENNPDKIKRNSENE